MADEQNVHESLGIGLLPIKVFIQDLKCSKKVGSSTSAEWKLNVPIRNNPSSNIPILYDGTIWIQGIIEQIAGNDNEILIISDTTGKAKIINCSSVPGDRSWISKGVYCSVVGVLIKEGCLPTVQAVKLTRVDKNAVHKSMWPLEVEELKLLLTKQASPYLDASVNIT